MKVRQVVQTLGEVVCESPPALVPGQRVWGATSIERLLRPLIGDEVQEVFCCLMLNAQHRVIAYHEVSRGTLTSSLVHPREVFGPALRLGTVAAIIAAHNHPSGDPSPSAEDIAVTRRLATAGQLLGVPLLDHVIVAAGEGFCSCRERGIGGLG